MNSTAFNTLEYFEKLKSAGFSEQQAKVQVEAMQGVVNNELTTKGDLREAELRILKWVIGTIITQTALIVAAIGSAVAIHLK